MQKYKNYYLVLKLETTKKRVTQLERIQNKADRYMAFLNKNEMLRYDHVHLCRSKRLKYAKVRIII